MISNNSSFFADIAIKAVKTIGPKSSLKLIGIQKQRGASLSDSILVDGFAIPKCFAYAGAKSQPYKFINPKIALIHVELELKAERSNAELKIETASQYQEAIDTEWKILFDKCDALVKSGANIVLSSLPIGDVAYQYFSDRGIYCGGRVAKEEMDRAMFSLGGSIQTSLDNMSSNLGECESFEEIQVGSERYTVFKGGKRSKSCTLILRGSGEFVLDEGKRNLHDALKVVQRIMSNPKVVPGGGAIEMAIAARMKKYSLEKLKGKEIIFMNSIAEALEIIPRILSQNCGFDETEIVSNLNKLHTESKHSYGVNIISKNGIDDNIKSGILEPKDLSMNKFNTLFESIAMVLSVNQTIKAPRLQAESQDMMNAKNALQDRS
ncbi:MAG: T-complex protein 1 subunit eta [Paramarteilia canceri]